MYIYSLCKPDCLVDLDRVVIIRNKCEALLYCVYYHSSSVAGKVGNIVCSFSGRMIQFCLK